MTILMIVTLSILWLLLAVTTLLLLAKRYGAIDLTDFAFCLLFAPLAFLILLSMSGDKIILWRRKK